MNGEADLTTGDAKTDARISAASSKVASGQPLSKDDAMALGAGAAGAIGVAAGVPGIGPVFAAMLVGEIAFVAGLDWFFNKIGLHAGAGPGKCAELGPPWGPTDPRYIHADDPSRGAGLGPVSSSANAWEPSRIAFEQFAITSISGIWEVWANCGPELPFTWSELLQKLADYWSATHDGPTVRYELAGGWGGSPPFGNFVPAGGLVVNVGPPKLARFTSPLHSGGLLAPSAHFAAGLSPTSAPLSTGEKVAIGVVGVGAAAGLAWGIWRFWPLARRLLP